MKNLETENLNLEREFKKKEQERVQKIEDESVKKKVKPDPLKELQKEYFNESINVVLDLLQTSSDLLFEVGTGKTGSNLNYKITKLVMKLNKYKFSKYVTVEKEDKAKMNLFQKQLKETIQALSKVKR